jgi:hypothetical protein
MLEEFALMIVYAACGSTMRILWGVYKAFSNFLDIELSKKRLGMEFAVSIMFGLFGGAVLSEMGVLKVGIDIGVLVSSLLGANVVDLIVKKFGFTKNMQVIVSDQQLQFTEFNRREMNALEYVKFKGKITNKVYQKINQTTQDIAKHELNALVVKGKLKEIGRTKGAYYVST